MRLTTKPLSAETWADLVAVFVGKGCSFARACWCMCYRESGKPEVPPGQALAETRRRRLGRLATSDTSVGLLGHLATKPVGWISFGPREDFKRLCKSPVMKPVDDEPVWSVVCFVVPSEHRRKGVASALLQAAIRFCKRRGVRLLEAYPIDQREPTNDQWLWHGCASMFEKAGFVEVARRKPKRPVVRLTISAKSGRIASRS
jgi:GNAT superfamily N-acetyltransferase